MATQEQMKFEAMRQVVEAMEVFAAKMKVVEAMDADPSSSGCMDMHDQFVTADKVMQDVRGMVERMASVVPTPS